MFAGLAVFFICFKFGNVIKKRICNIVIIYLSYTAPNGTPLLGVDQGLILRGFP